MMIAFTFSAGEVLQLVGLLGGVVLGVRDGQLGARFFASACGARLHLHEEGVVQRGDATGRA